MNRQLNYSGNGGLTVTAAAAVEPGPDEVQISVLLTGICGTDLHALHGHMDARMSLPSVLGHEAVGEVRALGADVRGLSVGDLVTIMPLIWCGTCAACQAGHNHVCQNLAFVGLDRNGSMQESWTVPAKIVVPLPPSMTPLQGVLVEPMAVAHHDVERAGLVAGDQVLVVGAGPIGMFIALVARSRGADVVVLEVDQSRREFAEAEGFTTLDPTDEGTSAHIHAWTDGAGVGVAFEVSGSAGGANSAIDALAVRGTLVVVGVHTEPRAVNLHRVFWRELSILGARVYTRADYEAAIEFLHGGLIEPSRFVSAVFSLEEGAAAFARLSSGQNAMKVLISSRPGAENVAQASPRQNTGQEEK